MAIENSNAIYILLIKSPSNSFAVSKEEKKKKKQWLPYGICVYSISWAIV